MRSTEPTHRRENLFSFGRFRRALRRMQTHLRRRRLSIEPSHVVISPERYDMIQRELGRVQQDALVYGMGITELSPLQNQIDAMHRQRTAAAAMNAQAQFRPGMVAWADEYGANLPWPAASNIAVPSTPPPPTRAPLRHREYSRSIRVDTSELVSPNNWFILEPGLQRLYEREFNSSSSVPNISRRGRRKKKFRITFARDYVMGQSPNQLLLEIMNGCKGKRINLQRSFVFVSKPAINAMYTTIEIHQESYAAQNNASLHKLELFLQELSAPVGASIGARIAQPEFVYPGEET